MTCYSYPGSAGTPGIPDRTITPFSLSWDGGADSVAELDGDVHVVFPMTNPSIGAIGGLKRTRFGIGVPELVDYGFQFENTPVGNFYSIVERGLEVVAPMERSGDLDEVFEIRRRGDVVRYVVNDETIYVSTLRSYGVLLTSACLFATGDTLG